jgi:hypothetical protein
VTTRTNGERFGWIVKLLLGAVVAVAYIHVTFVEQSDYDHDMDSLERHLTRIEKKIDQLR